jgi:hypothetical protein
LFVDFFSVYQSAGLMQGQCVRQQYGHTRQFRPLRLAVSFWLIAKAKLRFFLHAGLGVSKIAYSMKACESLLPS